MYDWTSQEFYPAPAPQRSVRFWPVRLDKFLVLMLCSLGLYAWVWFWRNWSAVNDEHPRSVSVLPRTIFSGIFYFSLVDRVGIPGGAFLAIGWIGSSTLVYLPGDWSMLALCAPLFLIPTAIAVNRMNGGLSWPPSSGWRKRDIFPVAIAGPIVALALFGILMPGYEVLRGSELDFEDLATLQEAGIVVDGEVIYYIYPDNPLDIASTGVMISDLGFTSYWIDPVTAELQVEYIPYAMMEGIEVNYASNWWDDTWVRIICIDGATMHFMLPNDDERGDKMFVGELRSHLDEEPPSDAGDA